ncbi:MAG: hypothetical protein BEN19_02660 [Epulopiscium sp. Nuni2H_MBin003]|nr:MAG: hypothetical protein BEN19_02660 [Epulopiscium sp. Nuni2H_MBin003]
MRKIIIGVTTIVVLIMGADFVIDRQFRDGSKLEAAEFQSITGGVDVSATPNGAVIYTDNINKIEINSMTVPIVIEEDDVDGIYVLDTLVLDNVSQNAKNTIKVQGNTLKFEEYNTDKKLLTKTQKYVGGELLIKVPVNTKLDYNIDVMSGDINLNALSNDIEINSMSGSVTIYKEGKDLEIDGMNSRINVYAPFENNEISNMSGAINLVAGLKTKDVEISTMSGSIAIEIEDNTPYGVSISTASGKLVDDYLNSSFKGSVEYGVNNGIDIEASTMSGDIRLTNWR